MFNKIFPKIHAEGYKFLVIAGIITIIFYIFSNFLALIGLLLTVWVYYFFRDPERVIINDDNYLVSPADGEVIKVEEVNGPKELGLENKNFKKISIFMNVFDCHVNRIPCSGKIEEILYKPGKFLNASLDKASEDNERNYYKIKDQHGNDIIVVQIAGLVARRIVCESNKDQDLKQGDRIGMIRFGSRADVYYENYEPLVKIGQTAIAGETLLAKKIMEPQKKNFKIVSDKKNARVILPNMLTLIGVCIGLTSIRFALDGRFEFAIIAIIFAALIDGLDGRIARLIKGTSKVGKELDSLTDMISFGVAPAFIMYFWKLNTLGRFGWLLCLVYVICVALRLARFNVNSNQESSWRDNFFEGVPSPAGAILVLTPLIFSLSGFDMIQLNYDLIVPTFFVVISFLLISKFPSYSFKKIVIPRRTTIFLLFGIVLFFGLLLIYTFNVITISAIIYLLLLPISFFHYQKIKKHHENDRIQDDDDLEDVL